MTQPYTACGQGSLHSYLHVTVCETDLHVSRAQPHSILESRGDDLALEDKLCELLPALAAHSDHDPSGASPYTVTRGLEAAGQELADSLGCLRRTHYRRPADGFGRWGRRPWRGLAEPGLLQGKPQQLGALLLFEEGG
jgi:hypothetical protein